MRASTTFVALEEPPEVAQANPIHGAEVAAQVGYLGALVSGIHTYGWATEAVIAAFGEEWLAAGWADISLRRPLYEGERITTTIEDDGTLRTAKDDGTIVLDGVAGMGDAPFRAELIRPERFDAEPSPAELGYLLPATAPIGTDFRPMSVAGRDSAGFSKRHLGESDGSRYLGDRPRMHPAWIAGRMTQLVRHSYHYGPAIHARTRMQHLSAGYAQGNVTVAARLVQVYERKGHWYHESDCLVVDENDAPIAHFRHNAVFRIAGFDYGY